MNKQINHDKHPDESKTRTHKFSKLSDDGDPWAPFLLSVKHFSCVLLHMYKKKKSMGVLGCLRVFWGVLRLFLGVLG